MSAGLPLIVLRAEDAARDTVARATAHGITARALPLFAIEACAWQVPAGPFAGMLLTSANAVRHAGPALRSLAHLPAHCVGGATAAAASRAGLAVVREGESGAQALVDGLEPGAYLWLAGEERTPIAAPPGVCVAAATVYRAVPLPVASGMLQGPAVVLVHSARAARQLREVAPDRASLRLVAISEGVAGACGAGWGGVVAAHMPDDGAMVAIAAKLCQEALHGPFDPR